MTEAEKKEGETPQVADAGDPQASDSAEKTAADPLTEAQAEAKRLKDVLMRTAADFDNFRKRSRREIEDARKGAREELLKELLPVFDNLERAVASAQRASDIKSMADGVAMVLRQLKDTLGRNGIVRVETVGKPFDPQVHDAIQQLESDEHPPGTVVAEVQPGYIQGERLLRAATVIVSKAKAEDPPAEEKPS